MSSLLRPRVCVIALPFLFLAIQPAQAQGDPVLPPGVKAVWTLDKASREQTATRERICLNGLWRWQPANSEGAQATLPKEQWGYFKVPGFWPGHANYALEDSQNLFEHPAWKGKGWRDTNAAWYQRDFQVPGNWTGRRTVLRAEYLNSLATVFVDDQKVGDIRFPLGEADLTKLCRPGGKYRLTLLVRALPLKAVMQSFGDTSAVKQIKGSVDRRGLCGDVFLVGQPAGPTITDVQIRTSIRKGEVALSAAFDSLAQGQYVLRTEIRDSAGAVHQFTSAPFSQSDLKSGRLAVSEKWLPTKVWDTNTSENMLTAQVALLTSKNELLDAALPIRFGFREFWIDGRDFYLNGKRIHLSAVPLDNAQLGPASATYEAARETMQRLRSFGINFVYTHNYGCEPGTCVSFEQILRAADDEGMLVAFSQPHFGQYDWKAADADRANGYARHVAFFVQAAQNHPSVVAYAMSHNATGYEEDMNPDLIDGLRDLHADSWSRNNAKLALRAEAIVKELDPGRIVYHHSSGNLGSMHTVNFYTNFVPIQEMSDWFEHWSKNGVKPVFLCEYGVPFSWDWTQYRGWYKGVRTFGSARVPWEFCLAEWDAQFLGDSAFELTDGEKRNIRWEADQFRAGRLWHRWDYPRSVGSPEFEQRQEVLARYLTDNWRAHRTWGLSANSPWEYTMFWRATPEAGKRKNYEVDWDHLQKPGFSPDFRQRSQGQFSTDYDRTDWIPTAAAQALFRNNMPLLGYIAGKPGEFTSKDHNMAAGESFEKQLIVINDSREPVECDCSWSLGLPERQSGVAKVKVAAGDQARVPLPFTLPTQLTAGVYKLGANFRFPNGQVQTDTFPIYLLPRSAHPLPKEKTALFDPKGETSRLLSRLGVRFEEVKATADLSAYDLLIVGKEALTADGPAPNIERVRDGLKVIVFEQTAKSLESRLGFRTAQYGLRQVFPRVKGHPALDGLDENSLRDWRGSATLSPPQLAYTMRPMHGPTIQWCDIPVSQAWRCGCRGNVASVLIEKPARGDFLPIVDGGYGLQFSTLLEYRQGKGLILFCQMDVTGRTETDPAAEMLVRNLLRYAETWNSRPSAKALYAGDAAGMRYLQRAGFAVDDFAAEALPTHRLLIVGPGPKEKLVGAQAAVQSWMKAGGRLLLLGQDGKDIHNLFSSSISFNNQEHIASVIPTSSMGSPFSGVGSADMLIRDPRTIPLVSAGATVLGDGALAESSDASEVLCQLIPWQFDQAKQMNLKRSFRSTARLLSRIAANMGAQFETPLLDHFERPVAPAQSEKRWLNSFYLDVPEEWDYPYRFFRW